MRRDRVDRPVPRRRRAPASLDRLDRSIDRRNGRRTGRRIGVAIGVIAGLGLVGTAPAAAGPCSVAWGSAAKVAGPMTQAPITSVRAGGQPCFDRLVIDLRSTPGPGFHVRYVSQVVADGSGAVVPLRGGARLQVAVQAPTYDSAGRPTYRPANPREAVATGGMRTFRQVAHASSFEGITTFGLGVRARLPFRVFVLPGPGAGSRLVIDVAHTWS